jgi:hypothetical protein
LRAPVSALSICRTSVSFQCYLLLAFINHQGDSTHSIDPRNENDRNSIAKH